MMLAAARAAFSASGESLGANPAVIAAVTSALRDASAVAMNVPARCWSLSDGSAASEDRLSFRSFAYSGRRFFRCSRDMRIPRVEKEVLRAGEWGANRRGAE